jgi:GPH family glycoside/pentoside/hexuronide:cation symporter
MLYAKRSNDNRKVMLTATFAMAFFTIPLIFLDSYVPLIIAIAVWGTSLGGWWLMMFPVIGDIIDESVTLHEKREEGTYTGIQQFFGRLGFVIQVLSFAIVHTLTGFQEASNFQTDLALFGIRIHLAIIPMICMFIGGLIFWKWYDLTPKRVEANQARIRELKL